MADGISMRAVSRKKGFPGRQTLLDWLEKYPEFRAKCARARKEAADVFEERILSTVDKVEAGQLEPDAGRVITSALQWVASKRDPKKYGDKTEVEHTGAIDHNIRLTEEQRMILIERKRASVERRLKEKAQTFEIEEGTNKACGTDEN